MTCRRCALRVKTEERLAVPWNDQDYEDHGLVFCAANGKPLEPVDFYRRFVRLLLQAGLPARRFHDARHTFATLMLELGESPKTVQTMLGHTTISTTLDIYSHVSLELEKRAASRLNEALPLVGHREDLCGCSWPLSGRQLLPKSGEILQ